MFSFMIKYSFQFRARGWPFITQVVVNLIDGFSKVLKFITELSLKFQRTVRFMRCKQLINVLGNY